MKVEKLLEIEMAPQSFDWWGTHYENVVPALVDEALGDGQAIIWFKSMDTRPNTWLVRVDGSVEAFTSDELREYVERSVIGAISNCFDECQCDDECECAFPTLILETGYSWGICGRDALMTYQEWHRRFAGHLLAQDMPLIALVQGRNIDRLLEAYHGQGFTPRVARMFNKRFIKAINHQGENANANQGNESRSS